MPLNMAEKIPLKLMPILCSTSPPQKEARAMPTLNAPSFSAIVSFCVFGVNVRDRWVANIFSGDMEAKPKNAIKKILITIT